MMDNLTMNTLYFGMTANEILSLSAKVKAAEWLVEALRKIERRDCHCDGWESCKNNYQTIASEALVNFDKFNVE